MINFKKYLTPKLFTGLAIVGVGVTVYFAVKETKNATVCKEEHVEQEETEPGDGLCSQSEVETKDSKARIKEAAGRVAETLWTYKFTGTSACCTILFILASHKLSAKEIAALTATCGYLATNRDKLETEIRKLPGGEEALKAVKKEMAVKGAEQLKTKEKKVGMWKYQTIEETGNGNLLCYDHWSGRYFRSSLDAVEQAQRRINDMIEDADPDILELDPNDVFDEYNLERTQLGSMFKLPTEEHEIHWNNVLIPVEKLDPVTMSRYDEDLLIIEYDQDSLPVPKGYFPSFPREMNHIYSL